MKLELQNLKLFRNLFILVFFVAVCTHAAFSMDGKSVALKFGASGYEAKFSDEKNTYIWTVYNPDIQVKLDLPVMDIKENCFLSLGFSYDFLWSGYNSSDLNVYLDDSLFSHNFSLQPELVFSKNDLRFIVGTGLDFGISSYDYEYKTRSTKERKSHTDYQFFWNLGVGLKYYLTETFSLLTDFTISVPFFTMTRDREYSKDGTNGTYADINSSGTTAMHFSPKVGVCWSF